MLNTIGKGTASHRIVVSLVSAAVVMGLAQMAVAFAPASGISSSGKESCAFSLQLQKSVQVRMKYLVKLDQALGGTALAGNAVEDMYGNIVPAAVSTDDDENPNSPLALLFGKQPAKNTPLLDSFSADCVSCHDGVGASSIGVDLRDRPFGRKPQVNSFVSDHPIGMTYSNYAAAGRGYKFIKPGTKMLFVEGKVGCLTCHDPLNPEKGHLAMSDRNSALCLTCHDK